MKISTIQWVLIGSGVFLIYNLVKGKKALDKWVQTPESSKAVKEEVKKDSGNKSWEELKAKGKVIFENAKSGKINPNQLNAEQKCLATFYQMSLYPDLKFKHKGTPEQYLEQCKSKMKATSKRKKVSFDGEYNAFIN